MKLKFGIIGCGRISPNHMAAAKENALDIACLCDVLVEKSEKLAEDFGLKIDGANESESISTESSCAPSIKQYTDYKEMLKNEELDLIAICTESGKHAKIALDCIKAGVNLIIEKPIALSLDEADEIILKSKEKGIKVCACHQNRFNKSVLKMREALEDGRFGKLMHGAAHIRWNRGENYYTQATWRGTWEEDGGALMNQCIHNIDLLRWMMGSEITEVVGFNDNLNHDYIEAEDLGLALVKFANGSYGIIEGTTNIYPKNLEETLYIFGQKGTVKIGGKSVNIIEEWNFADGKDDLELIKKEFSENPPSVYGFGHSPLYKDVIDSIKNDRQPKITAEDGRRALELVLAIYKSAADGSSVKLPLNGVKSTDFKGRFK